MIHWGNCVYSQCMNIALHVRAKGIINHPMPIDPALARKLIRHDLDIKVPFTFFGTSVTSMQMTLILNQNLCRSESIYQELFNGIHSLTHSDVSSGI